MPKRLAWACIAVAYLLMALVFALHACADAMIVESRDSARSGFFDAAATLGGLAGGLIESAKVILAVAAAALVLALIFGIFSFFARKRPPAAVALIDSLDHVRVAVDRIMEAGAEASDIGTLRAKIAAERSELEALRETTVEQRRAVLAQSGTKKWTVISIVAGLVGSAGLALAMDSVLDRL